MQGIGNIFEKIVKENFLKMTKVIDVNTQEAESPISFRVPSHLGLSASWVFMSITFTILGKFSFTLFSNRFLISCSLSYPFGTAIM